MKIKGTVSRVLEEDSRVFVRPDADDQKKLKGDALMASGEVAGKPVKKIGEYEVGQTDEIEIDDDQGSEPTASTPST